MRKKTEVTIQTTEEPLKGQVQIKNIRLGSALSGHQLLKLGTLNGFGSPLKAECQESIARIG